MNTYSTFNMYDVGCRGSAHIFLQLRSYLGYLVYSLARLRAMSQNNYNTIRCGVGYGEVGRWEDTTHTHTRRGGATHKARTADRRCGESVKKVPHLVIRFSVRRGSPPRHPSKPRNQKQHHGTESL